MNCYIPHFNSYFLHNSEAEIKKIEAPLYLIKEVGVFTTDFISSPYDNNYTEHNGLFYASNCWSPHLPTM